MYEFQYTENRLTHMCVYMFDRVWRRCSCLHVYAKAVKAIVSDRMRERDTVCHSTHPLWTTLYGMPIHRYALVRCAHAATHQIYIYFNSNFFSNRLLPVFDRNEE